MVSFSTLKCIIDDVDTHHWWQLGWDRIFSLTCKLNYLHKKKTPDKRPENSMTINYIGVEHNSQSSTLPFPNLVVTSTVLVSNSKYVCPSSHSSLATDQEKISNNDGHWHKIKYAIFCNMESTEMNMTYHCTLCLVNFGVPNNFFHPVIWVEVTMWCKKTSKALVLLPQQGQEGREFSNILCICAWQSAPLVHECMCVRVHRCVVS